MDSKREDSSSDPFPLLHPLELGPVHLQYLLHGGGVLGPLVVPTTEGVIYVKVSVMVRRVMSEAALKRLERKLDALSEFLEDIYLTKGEEERLKKADEIVGKGRLKELTKVV